ncbi:Hypothetical protein PENO1_093460 [Penicillium occitanis (nom. inval.)]|nr:Hypothetical protein PENO1_093460 [Penicillium occitanis (nom. inval.)]PCG91944.1 hypothetical protein PENOC_094880 [Penicillium occitanis (nom. inval.)]
MDTIPPVYWNADLELREMTFMRDRRDRYVRSAATCRSYARYPPHMRDMCSSIHHSHKALIEQFLALAKAGKREEAVVIARRLESLARAGPKGMTRSQLKKRKVETVEYSDGPPDPSIESVRHRPFAFLDQAVREDGSVDQALFDTVLAAFQEWQRCFLIGRYSAGGAGGTA